MAKAALNAYVKGISVPLADQELRINAVTPGNILFEGSVWDKKLNNNPELVKAMLENEVPLKKLGSAQDVAEVVSFLTSDLANFITGSSFVLDGGQTKSFG